MIARVYLAGPMRGIPDFNFPAFDAAAKELRALGYEVFSPADHDRSVHGDDFAKGTSGDHTEIPEFSIRNALGADLAWICEHADAVMVLDGWKASKGAKAEVATAEALGVPVYPVRLILKVEARS